MILNGGARLRICLSLTRVCDATREECLRSGMSLVPAQAVNQNGRGDRLILTRNLVYLYTGSHINALNLNMFILPHFYPLTPCAAATLAQNFTRGEGTFSCLIYPKYKGLLVGSSESSHFKIKIKKKFCVVSVTGSSFWKIW